jgi:hypothetical protein
MQTPVFAIDLDDGTVPFGARGIITANTGALLRRADALSRRPSCPYFAT